MLKRKPIPTDLYLKNRVDTIDMTATNLMILTRTLENQLHRSIDAGGFMSLSAMEMCADMVGEIESLTKIQMTTALSLCKFVESEIGKRYCQGKMFEEKQVGAECNL